MSASIGIGLVGCGAMGRTHAQVWEGIEEARIVAVCDSQAEAAARVAEGHGAIACADLGELLRVPGVDAVDICTPSGMHAAQVLAAARSGRHVLCEKPLGLRLDEVDAAIAEVERRGLRLGCVFQRRAFAAPRSVAQAVHAGHMGRLLLCSASVKWWRDQAYYDSSAWRGTWAMDGGVLANQAIHAIDHLCWLAGRVVEVEVAHLETAAHGMEAEDLALAVVRYESGALGVIEATTCSNPPLSSRVEVVGTRGSAAFDEAMLVRLGLDGVEQPLGAGADEGRLGGSGRAADISLHGHALLLRDFALAVRDGRPPMVDGHAARMSVEALALIYARAGLPPVSSR